MRFFVLFVVGVVFVQVYKDVVKVLCCFCKVIIIYDKFVLDKELFYFIQVDFCYMLIFFDLIFIVYNEINFYFDLL